MSSARHYTLEELQLKQQRISQRQAHLMESAKRAAAREKALKKKIVRQETDEKQKRLTARGELLESFFEDAPRMSNEQLTEILSLAFSQTDVKNAIRNTSVSAPNVSVPTYSIRKEDSDERD